MSPGPSVLHVLKSESRSPYRLQALVFTFAAVSAFVSRCFNLKLPAVPS